jgi:hypothetical protein
MAVPRNKAKEIELEPDAWARFERFIRNMAKAGPQHRTTKPKRRRKITKDAASAAKR